MHINHHSMCALLAADKLIISFFLRFTLNKHLFPNASHSIEWKEWVLLEPDRTASCAQQRVQNQYCISSIFALKIVTKSWITFGTTRQSWEISYLSADFKNSPFPPVPNIYSLIYQWNVLNGEGFLQFLVAPAEQGGSVRRNILAQRGGSGAGLGVGAPEGPVHKSSSETTELDQNSTALICRSVPPKSSGFGCRVLREAQQSGSVLSNVTTWLGGEFQSHPRTIPQKWYFPPSAQFYAFSEIGFPFSFSY